MNEQISYNEAEKRLRALGFSSADFSLCERHGWTPRDILADVTRLFNAGLTTEKFARTTFEEANPELFSEEPPDIGQSSTTPFLACFKTLDTIEEEEPKWFIDGFIPEGQIATMASDGGVGKTTMSTDIAANRSAGKACFLDPPGFSCKPQLVAFLSTEDSVKKKLKRKLREAGANMSNIIVPDFSEDTNGLLRGFKFGTDEMAQFVRYYKPTFTMLLPLPRVPPMLNMGARNAMRDCMAPLVSLGEETGTTFLIICHTNKRKGASGRDRIADSADLWDISRSVLMLGFTEEQGVRYLSHEKSNYGELQPTRLFTIDADGHILLQGTSWKRDREYQQEAAFNVSAPRREDCKEWIIHELEANGNSMLTADLEKQAEADGFTRSTLRRAKDELKKESEIEYFNTGVGKDKIWYIRRVSLPDGWNT